MEYLKLKFTHDLEVRISLALVNKNWNSPYVILGLQNMCEESQHVLFDSRIFAKEIYIETLAIHPILSHPRSDSKAIIGSYDL